MSSSIIASLRYVAEQQPEKPAFITVDTETDSEIVLSYSELLSQVENTAAKLLSMEVTCLALRSENSVQWIVTDLAAMLAGVIIVPVPVFFSPAQIAHLLDASGADLLVGDWPGKGRPDTEIAGLPACCFKHKETTRLLSETAKVTFTSGSTGTPKGVCLSQSQLDTVSLSLKTALEKDVVCQRHLILLPLSTLLENITGVYLPLLFGSASVVLPGELVGIVGSSRLDPQRLAAALLRYRPDTLVLTPALLMALIQLVSLNPMLAEPLKFVAVGGARVAPSLLAKAHALGIPAYEGYGQSECASVVCLNTPSLSRAGTSGQVLPHAKVTISERGEILVQGNRAIGYIGEPFEEAWLATGDLGMLDDEGFLTITGRIKNQIITSFGRNISPEWIESEAQAFPALSRIVIVGDGEQHLTAIVFGKDAEPVLTALNRLNEQLPDYARISRLLLTPEIQGENMFTANGRPVRPALESWARKQYDDSQAVFSVATYWLNGL